MNAYLVSSIICFGRITINVDACCAGYDVGVGGQVVVQCIFCFVGRPVIVGHAPVLAVQDLLYVVSISNANSLYGKLYKSSSKYKFKLN